MKFNCKLHSVSVRVTWCSLDKKEVSWTTASVLAFHKQIQGEKVKLQTGGYFYRFADRTAVAIEGIQGLGQRSNGIAGQREGVTRTCSLTHRHTHSHTHTHWHTHSLTLGFVQRDRLDEVERRHVQLPLALQRAEQAESVFVSRHVDVAVVQTVAPGLHHTHKETNDKNKNSNNCYYDYWDTILTFFLNQDAIWYCPTLNFRYQPKPKCAAALKERILVHLDCGFPLYVSNDVITYGPILLAASQHWNHTLLCPD